MSTGHWCEIHIQVPVPVGNRKRVLSVWSGGLDFGYLGLDLDHRLVENYREIDLRSSLQRLGDGGR